MFWFALIFIVSLDQWVFFEFHWINFNTAISFKTWWVFNQSESPGYHRFLPLLFVAPDWIRFVFSSCSGWWWDLVGVVRQNWCTFVVSNWTYQSLAATSLALIDLQWVNVPCFPCPWTSISEYFFPWLDSFCLWSRWPHRWATFDFLVSRWPHRWAVKGEWNKQLLQGINEGPGYRQLTGGGVHCNFLPRLLYFLHLTFDCMWCEVCFFLEQLYFHRWGLAGCGVRRKIGSLFFLGRDFPCGPFVVLTAVFQQTFCKIVPFFLFK